MGKSTLRTPAVLAWLRLARVFAKIERATTAQFRECDASAAQFDVLAQVGAHEGCTQRELAEALLVTKGNVTQILDRMEAAGLLCRHQEGRSKHVRLTPQGWALRQQLIPTHEAHVAALFEGLSESEQRELLRLLRKLDQSLAAACQRAEAAAAAAPAVALEEVS